LQRWEDLDWLTPDSKFFNVAHYNRPHIDEQDWSLEITGLVRKPGRFRLTDIRARPRHELTLTIECSGNNGRPSFLTGIGTARWAGMPLAAMLREAEVMDGGIEVVFVGADGGEEQVRGIKMATSFARSLSLADAMGADNLLCYEMDGGPLPAVHGFPLRLIAPGWYGIANVKWLTRIEVWPTRLENRFMGRDYVTIHEEKHNGRTGWVETSVGRVQIKSAPAKILRQDGHYKIVGMAWGAPIARVEVSIDNGPWQIATKDPTRQEKYAWHLWSLDWPAPAPGEHAVASRAVGIDGNVQPAPTDPQIASKHTFWESNGQITRRIRLS
jgi:DMSO/TMAO reductase YedYZ molybdopterin-dependent catalytic subunit